MSEADARYRASDNQVVENSFLPNQKGAGDLAGEEPCPASVLQLSSASTLVNFGRRPGRTLEVRTHLAGHHSMNHCELSEDLSYLEKADSEPIHS